MAYFSNGTTGAVLDAQCGECTLGDKSCPVALVQIVYNYDAVGNQMATDILNKLVTSDGICSMKSTYEEKLQTQEQSDPKEDLSKEADGIVHALLTFEGKDTLSQEVEQRIRKLLQGAYDIAKSTGSSKAEMLERLIQIAENTGVSKSNPFYKQFGSLDFLRHKLDTYIQ